MKRIKIPKENYTDKKECTCFNREVAILKNIEHPLIAQLFQILEDNKNNYLVLEYCEGKKLTKYIEEVEKLDEDIARQYFFPNFLHY